MNTRAGNGQFVRNKKFQAIAEQGDKKKSKRVTIDCGSDGSTSCGGCEEEREEERDK